MVEQQKPSSSFTDLIDNGLLKQRIIWLDSEVNSESANRISKQLMLLAADEPTRDITMYINSPGGSITDGMAIYDIMQLISPDVVTIAIGMAASMGQFLLSSGTKGKRFITPNARVLMHQPSGGVGGTATDVRIGAELIMDMKQRLSNLTAEQTGQTLEKILEDNEHDNWFTAQEALEYGFVDHIIQNASDVTSKGVKNAK
ncbi:MAG: ATP-dependent Clp protease proteolytic subunit [Candidatus Ancillula sp.]|jgi:ATP-dependent Clp protease protease subunit|nr:ATP-dependent Clp protease proteolytic subunit [Candidatus Ancillula sp.]